MWSINLFKIKMQFGPFFYIRTFLLIINENIFFEKELNIILFMILCHDKVTKFSQNSELLK